MSRSATDPRALPAEVHSAAATEAPTLTVVVPSRDTRALTDRCLRSVLAQSIAELELIVVDDGSRAEESVIPPADPRVRLVVNQQPRGYAAAVNRGAALGRGQILLLLNSDTELRAGALEALLAAFAADARLGVAGAQLEYPDGAPQWSGGPEPGLLWLFVLASGIATALGRLRGYRRIRPVSGTDARPVVWASGAALAVRRDAWDELRALDESFRHYAQDIDLCLRARSGGWRVIVAPGVRVVHHHGATVENGSDHVVAHQNLELLWLDLADLVARHKSPTAARTAVAALRLGASVRLAGATLKTVLGSEPHRAAARAEIAAVRAARRALGTWSLPLRH